MGHHCTHNPRFTVFGNRPMDVFVGGLLLTLIIAVILLALSYRNAAVIVSLTGQLICGVHITICFIRDAIGRAR